MADVAGAFAAIEQRLVDGSPLPVALENEAPPAATDAAGNLVPWALCEIVCDGTWIVGSGTPGNHVLLASGAVEVTVFVPAGTGRQDARTHAVAIGQIFRCAKFYDDEPSTYVRTWTPNVGRGRTAASENPSGNWWAVTVSIPFEFYHRA